MKYLSALVLILLSAFTAYAGSSKDDNFEFNHNRFLSAECLHLPDALQLEFGYHYMFNRYVGIGGAVGAWQVYFEDGFASGSNWDIESDDNKPWNFFLRPSVILKTPALRLGQVNLGLFAEPGS